MWNSGRLPSSSAIVSPRRTPSACSPRANASTRSRSSAQVSETSSSLVRTATRSGWSSAVIRKASAMVAAPTARDPAAAGAVMGRPYLRGLTDVEALAGQSPDVVRQADHGEPDDEREADEPGPLHGRERDRPAAHLLGQGPEDVPAVERQEREQVDDAQGQRDDREQEDRAVGGQLDRLAGRLVGADHAGDLLALLGVEDAGDRLHGGLREEPELVRARGDRVAHAAHRLEGAVDAVAEAEQRPAQVGVVDRRDLDGPLAAVAEDRDRGRLRRAAAVLRRPGARVGGDLAL